MSLEDIQVEATEIFTELCGDLIDALTSAEQGRSEDDARACLKQAFILAKRMVGRLQPLVGHCPHGPEDIEDSGDAP